MSTKCTIAYNDKFHFYDEAFDVDEVHLELRGPDVEFTASPGFVDVRIQPDVMDAICDAWIKRRNTRTPDAR